MIQSKEESVHAADLTAVLLEETATATPTLCRRHPGKTLYQQKDWVAQTSGNLKTLLEKITIKIYTCYHTLNRLSHKCNFYMHQETKKFIWPTLLKYLLYRNDLEPNLQYLQGILI